MMEINEDRIRFVLDRMLDNSEDMLEKLELYKLYQTGLKNDIDEVLKIIETKMERWLRLDRGNRTKK